MNTQSPKPRITLVMKGVDGKSGGAERIYCELANMLSRDGNDVSCFSFDVPGGETFYPLDAEVNRVTAGQEGRRFKAVLQSAFYKLMPKKIEYRDRLRWHARNDHLVVQLQTFLQAEQPDVVISLLPPANTITLLAAKKLRTKVIVTNHNVPEQDYTSKRWGI